MKRMVYISDCDHVNIDEEIAVFERNQVGYKKLSCLTEDALIMSLRDAESVICQYARFTENVFAHLPRLRLLVRYGVGVDNIDVDAATKHGVRVCNVPDYGVEEVAAQALTLMLALTRKVIPMDRYVHEGVWEYEKSIPIKRISESTVGVIGFGRIGSVFARQMQQLTHKIIAYDPFLEALPDPSVEMVGLDELLERADMISLHCPLESSRGLIGREQLQKMKQTAYIVNVSRGGIIDESALDEALSKGWIAGAAVDVLEVEPIRPDCPLLHHDNFICTPHMAWYSQEAASDLKRKAAEEAVKLFTGEKLRYALNKIGGRI